MRLLTAVLCLLTSAFLASAQTWITNSLTISETNTNYDGLDLLISGAGVTVALDGPHAFNSLLLTNGAVLTHSPCTTSATHKLDLLVTNAITISTNSRIDVSGKGYGAGRTSGNTTAGASTGASGGGYGGVGGVIRGQSNALYGDYADPDDWGSGSGTEWGGVAGGGLLHLEATRLVLNGSLLADGTGDYGGAGSGGGIRVAVGVLEGSGTIRAKGGQSGNHGAGGGGRVAVWADDYSRFNLANIEAPRGVNVGGEGQPGQAGSVYVRNPARAFGVVFISGNPGPTALATLGASGTNAVSLPDVVVIQGDTSQVPMERLLLPPATRLAAAEILALCQGPAWTIVGNIEVDGPLEVPSGLTLAVLGKLTGLETIRVEGGNIIAEVVRAPSLLVTNQGLLTTFPATATKAHGLEVVVANEIVVSTDSRIDVSGKGYGAGRTSGNTTAGAATGASGGGYGGVGGVIRGQSNALYGDYADPDDWGSGSGTEWGGVAGGGLLHLTTARLALSGSLLADGTDDYGGAGSGGGIRVAVGVLEGIGIIRAKGGQSGNHGAGGGGRVAVWAQDYSRFNLANIAAPRGVNIGGEGQPGRAGTVWVVRGAIRAHVRYTLPGWLPIFPTNGVTFLTMGITNGLAILFNKPIATNSFTPAKLLIQGPVSAVVPTGLSEIGDRLYRIGFPPQTEQGAYRFTLLPTLLDAEGFQLDQNANGIPGEPDDAYNFTLILDTIPPRVTQHAPAGDVAGTASFVDVWITEQIDTSTFIPANIVITNSTGQSISVSSISQVGLNRWRLGFPSQTTPSLYHVLLSKSITDLAGNPLTSDLPAPSGFAYDAWFNLVPVHLLLSNVALSTNQFWSGDAATICWSGRNESGAPLLGSWYDGVYLSQNDRWDINDILLTTVPHTNGLASNEVYSACANVFVPGALPGDYHLIIRADVFMQEKPPTNQPNNFVATPIPVTVPELTLGTPHADQFVSRKHARYYRVTVPDNADLRVTLDLAAATGATELYIRREDIPTRSAFDVKYSAPFQPDQVVRVPGTPAGTYYLLAYADTLASEPAPFTLLAELLPFALTGVTPNHGGNAGNVTLRLTGSGITSNSTAKLVYPGSNGVPVEVRPIRTRRADMSELQATFALQGIAPLVADIVLVGSGGQTVMLTGAFSIEVGMPQQLHIDAQGPASIRRGGSPGKYVVRIQNRSNQDADYVSVGAWAPSDAQVGMAVSMNELGPLQAKTKQGFVSLIIPQLPVGGETVLAYDVNVGRSYGGNGAPLSWRTETENRAEVIAEFAASAEGLRTRTLLIPNLQLEYPELFALAIDRAAWAASFASALHRKGYLSDQELLAGLPAGRSAKGLGLTPCQQCTMVAIVGCGAIAIPAPWLGVGCAAFYYPFCETLYCNPPPPPPSCVVTLPNGTTISIPNCCGVTVSASGAFTTVPCTPAPVDPNMMEGPGGVGLGRFVPDDVIMPYLIQFENRPEASGAAVQVTITNQLGPELDWHTFAFTEIGFAGVKLAVPDGLSHFETRMPFAGWTWNSSNGWHRGNTPLMVDVKAGLDIATGLISVTLACSDTNTGTFPEDAFAGFLPPNKPELAYYGTNAAGCCGQVDTNVLIQPGQGYMSYTVRPRTNLVTGTRITNAASIYFDWNDPIDTPTVFNTIDAGAPVSSVLALPAESGRTFLVQWAGADDLGGSGVANYDVYVSTDGKSFSQWQTATSATSAWYVGQLGQTHLFYSVARDWVGHEQAKPNFPQALTTVATNAPVLVVATNRPAVPGASLVLTNKLVSGTPLGAFRFSLGQGAPDGATIDATNGVFTWMPSCSQASRSYDITIWVTDTGNTNLLDATAFTVAVSECVVPSLGRLVLRAGDSGRVPINLISSVPLTNLAMTVAAAAGRLTNLWIEPIVSQICTSSLTPALSHPMGEGDFFDLSLKTCSGQFLIGTQQVAWLHFATVSNLSSAFVSLKLDNITGFQVDGTAVRNFAPQAGRLVIIGEEPLLECLLGTNGRPSLTLYGKPGWHCALEQKTNLLAAGGWPEFTRVTMDELFMPIAIPGTGARNFFRAVRLPAGPARLSLESVIGPVYRFKLSGQTGAHYAIEMTTSLPPPGPWLPVVDLTLTNGSGWFDWTNSGEPGRFFRAVGR